MKRVEKTIIRRLTYKTRLRYAELKPKNIEGNLFTYYLKKLIIEGLIKKDNQGYYRLTGQGRLFADKVNYETFSPRAQPKIVTMLICQNNKGQILIYKRRNQPFSGLTSFPFGKLHLGEQVLDAAERELWEKSGLQADRLHHIGDVYLTIYQEKELISQMLAHVFAGSVKKDELVTKTRCFWTDFKKIKPERYSPGFRDIYRLYQKSNDQFFAEYTYYL